MFTQLEADLQIGRIALGTFACIVDRQFGAPFLRRGQRLGPLAVALIPRDMRRQKFRVRRDLTLGPFSLQIGNLPHQARIITAR